MLSTSSCAGYFTCTLLSCIGDTATCGTLQAFFSVFFVKREWVKYVLLLIFPRHDCAQAQTTRQIIAPHSVLHSFHRVRNRRQRIDSRKRRNPQRVGYNRSNARPCPTSLLSILPAGISYFYPLQTAQTGEESSQSPRTRRMRPQRDSAV